MSNPDLSFYWNQSNTEHIGKHGVSADDAEFVVRRAVEPFPWRHSPDKFLVWGTDPAGRLIQVIFVLMPDDTIYVIHARPLDRKERNQWHGQENQ